MAFDENIEKDEQDKWIHNEDREKRIRIHKQARKAKFTPRAIRKSPVPIGCLTSHRMIYKVFGDGSRKIENVDWRGEMGHKEAGAMR